jgi:ABC-type nitrate/sulfonate/bicarbonate transport system substrate-binding protein
MRKILIIISALCLFVNSAIAETKTKIRVNTFPGIDSMIVWNDALKRLPGVAKRYGINDLTVEETPTASSTLANDLLINGQLDVVAGAPTTMLILEGKMPGQIKFLSGLQYYDTSLLCQPGIKTIKEASKYNIVMQAYFSGQHMFAKVLAKKHFGDANALEKNILILPVSSIVSTFEAKLTPAKSTVQCAIVPTPYVNQLMDLGMEIIETSNLKEGTGGYNAIWTQKKWADANPKLAEALIVSLRESQQAYTTAEGQRAAVEYTVKKEKREATVDLILKRSKQNNEIVWREPHVMLEKWVDIIYEFQFIKGEKPKDLKALVWKPELLK